MSGLMLFLFVKAAHNICPVEIYFANVIQIIDFYSRFLRTSAGVILFIFRTSSAFTIK